MITRAYSPRRRLERTGHPNASTFAVDAAVNITVSTARRQVARLGFLMCTLNLILPLGLWVYARMIDEEYWRMFRGEDTVIEWFSSIQLLVLAFVAYVTYYTTGLLRRLGSTHVADHQWVWLALAFGFVILGLDERFDIHEALRDNFFRPAGLFVDVPYVISGDVGLYLFFVIGVLLSPLLWDELGRWPPSRTCFSAALVLTLLVVIIDSLKDSAMRDWPYVQFWNYTFEEVGEVWAQLLFLLAFLLVLNGRFGQLVHVHHADTQ